MPTCVRCRRELGASVALCPQCGTPNPEARTLATPEGGGFKELPPWDDLKFALQGALGADFIVEERLGEGGFAIVFLVQDRKLSRRIAVKMLRPSLTANPTDVRRFVREAESAASLNHPHIVPIFFVGQRQGLVYFGMPLMDGESLAALLAREGPLSPDEVVRIGSAVADGLAEAHAKGLVHRDIKPANILLQGKGRHPLVADFGVAKAAPGAGEQLTATGMLVGTPHYMSPEQAAGRADVDSRSDIYSLGIMLWQMVAGTMPFDTPGGDSSDSQRILMQHLTQPLPSLRQRQPATPAALVDAIERCAAKQREDRFQTAQEVAEALRGGARRRATNTTRWGRIAAGLALAVTAGLVAAALLLRPRGPAFTGAASTRRQVTFTGTSSELALAPDGKMLAYRSGDRIVVQDLAGGDPVPVFVAAAHTEEWLGPIRWSPDGARLLIRGTIDTTAGLYSVARLGGTPWQVAGESIYFAFHPDGNTALVERIDSLNYKAVVDVGTGAVRDSFTLGRAYSNACDVDWSRNGRWIALCEFSGDAGHALQVAVVTPNGTVTDTWQPDGFSGFVRWNATSDALYYTSRSRLMRVGVDPGTGRRRGSPTTVMDITPQSFGEFDIAADGRTMAFSARTSRSQVWVAELAPGTTRATGVRQLTSGTASHTGPAMAPDGRTVAFQSRDATGVNVYSVPYGGGTARPITTSSQSHSGLRWAPTGNALLMTRASASDTELVLLELSGGLPRSLGRDSGQAAHDWFPDGKRILLYRRAQRSLAIMNLAGHIESELPYPDSVHQTYSAAAAPDGQRVAIEAGSGLYLAPLNGGPWRPLATGPHHAAWPLAWMGNGEVLVTPYWSRDGRTEIWRTPASGGAPRLYLETPKDCLAYSISFSLDRRRMACEVRETETDIWMAANFDPDGHR